MDERIKELLALIHRLEQELEIAHEQLCKLYGECKHNYTRISGPDGGGNYIWECSKCGHRYMK